MDHGHPPPDGDVGGMAVKWVAAKLSGAQIRYKVSPRTLGGKSDSSKIENGQIEGVQIKVLET